MGDEQSGELLLDEQPQQLVVEPLPGDLVERLIPPESWRGRFDSKPERPTRSITFATFSARWALGTPSSSASSSTFLVTVRHGSSVASWKT